MVPGASTHMCKLASRRCRRNIVRDTGSINTKPMRVRSLHKKLAIVRASKQKNQNASEREGVMNKLLKARADRKAANARRPPLFLRSATVRQSALDLAPEMLQTEANRHALGRPEPPSNRA